jgi:hypothetical protein
LRYVAFGTLGTLGTLTPVGHHIGGVIDHKRRGHITPGDHSGLTDPTRYTQRRRVADDQESPIPPRRDHTPPGQIPTTHGITEYLPRHTSSRTNSGGI